MLYRDRPPVKIVFYGLIPLFAWETFSVVYYGFPLPNTYYTKLNTGIGRLSLIKHGGDYFFNSILIDPATLFTIFSAIIVSLIGLIKKKNGVFPFVSAGIVLYLLYILYIGGDFMSGRFFACCVPYSLFILCCLVKKQKFIYAFLLVFVFLCLNSPFYSVYNFSAENKVMTQNSVQIVSEREFYHPVTGLLNVLTKGKKAIDESGYAKDAKRVKNDTSMQKKTAISIAIGMFGFYAGPDVYIIDQVSIADAFTARLPAAKRWRIGHFAREWPEGYEETLRQGTNLIKDSDLSMLYDKISLITKGRIFSRERFKAIIEVNLKNNFHLKG
jgi:arabinofuranosyltransferase